MEYLGFDVGYGWWELAASKMQPLQDMQIRDDPKKGLHDVRSFVGACNFHRRHIHNLTYSSGSELDAKEGVCSPDPPLPSKATVCGPTLLSENEYAS